MNEGRRQALGGEIQDDERKFIDRAHPPFVIGEEEVIIDGGGED